MSDEWFEKYIESLEKRITKLDNKMDDLDEKMDDLLKFKWQIMGGTMIVSIVVGIVLQILIAAFGK